MSRAPSSSSSSGGTLPEDLAAALRRIQELEEEKRAAEEGKRAVEEAKRVAEEEKRAAEEGKRVAEEGKRAAEEAKRAEETKRKAAEEETKKLREEFLLIPGRVSKKLKVMGGRELVVVGNEEVVRFAESNIEFADMGAATRTRGRFSRSPIPQLIPEVCERIFRHLGLKNERTLWRSIELRGVSKDFLYCWHQFLYMSLERYESLRRWIYHEMKTKTKYPRCWTPLLTDDYANRKIHDFLAFGAGTTAAVPTKLVSQVAVIKQDLGVDKLEKHYKRLDGSEQKDLPTPHTLYSYRGPMVPWMKHCEPEVVACIWSLRLTHETPSPSPSPALSPSP